MTTDALQGLYYPASSDDADVPDDMRQLAESLRSKLVMTFASAAARTSAFTAAGVSPANGMVCYRTDANGTNKFEYYNATAAAWRVFGPYRDSSTLGSAASSITISNIPTYLKSVVLRCSLRGDTATAFTNVQIQIGADTSTSNYIYSLTYTNAGAHNFGTGTTTGYILAAFAPAATSTAGLFGSTVVDFAGWDSPHANCLAATLRGGYTASAANHLYGYGQGAYLGGSAYTSIKVYPAAGNWVTGSEVSVVGTE